MKSIWAMLWRPRSPGIRGAHKQCRPHLEALESRDVPSTLLVSNLNDSGPGSLRQALLDANSIAGNDTIAFAAGVTGTINVNSTLPDLSSNIDLEGPGPASVTVKNGFFYIPEGSVVTIAGLTINANLGNTGGISTQLANLTVNNCIVSANAGGGIFQSGGSTIIENSTITGNFASGGNQSGGIVNSTGTMTIRNCTISSNTGGVGMTGAGVNNAGTMTIIDSTIAANTIQGNGGGVSNSGTLAIINSTITGNAAQGYTATFPRPDHFVPGNGGGIWNTGGLSITNCTIADNTAATGSGGGINISTGGTATTQNTIFAQNTAQTSNDAVGAFTSLGHNLVGDGTGSTGFTAVGDQVGNATTPINPQLGPLQDNGGTTSTMALLTGSPALDAGSDAVVSAPLLLTTDQRGSTFVRKYGVHVDIGAFESQPSQSRYVIASGGGTQADVRVYSAFSNQLLLAINPFAHYNGEVRCALADINHDSVPDVIVGATINGHVKVFDGMTGALLRSFLAFPGYNGAVHVAGGDVNGDGYKDIIVSADNAPGGHVKAFSGKDGSLLASFLSYAGFAGQVTVASADFNHDGTDEIVTAASSNGHVKVFNAAGGIFSTPTFFGSFLAFAGFAGPVSVAAGDINGDGIADIVVGAQVGPGHVKAFSGASGALLASFLAYEATSQAGANVSLSDYYSDHRLEIRTTPGRGRRVEVRVFNPLSPTSMLDAFDPFDNYDGGANVGGA